MFPHNSAEKPNLTLDSGIVHRVVPGPSRVLVGVAPVNDENQQNLKIQQAVNRYNGTVPSHWRPSSLFKCNLLKSRASRPLLSEQVSSIDTNSCQKPENRYASVGHFPTVFLGKAHGRPIKKSILPHLRVNSPGLPVSRFLDDSAEKYSDLKTTRSVLDVLQDLSRKRIHSKDDNEDTTKRRCKGLGGDLVQEGEIHYRPLFVTKPKTQYTPQKDQTTQTQCDESNLETSEPQGIAVHDPKWELRKQLAQQNNEILASYTSSLNGTWLAKRKRVAATNTNAIEEEIVIKKKKILNQEVSDQPTPLRIIKPTTHGSPRSPPSKDRLMGIYWDLQNVGDAKRDALKTLQTSPGAAQFQRSNPCTESEETANQQATSQTCSPSSLQSTLSATPSLKVNGIPLNSMLATPTSASTPENKSVAATESKTTPTFSFGLKKPIVDSKLSDASAIPLSTEQVGLGNLSPAVDSPKLTSGSSGLQILNTADGSMPQFTFGQSNVSNAKPSHSSPLEVKKATSPLLQSSTNSISTLPQISPSQPLPFGTLSSSSSAFGPVKADAVETSSINFQQIKTQSPIKAGSPNISADKVDSASNLSLIQAKTLISNTSTSQPTFNFGTKSEASSEPQSQPAFSFGQSKAENSANSPSKGSFKFGQSKEATSEAISTSQPTFSFGKSKTESGANSMPQATFNFGATSETSTGTTLPTSKPEISVTSTFPSPSLNFSSNKIESSAPVSNTPTTFSFGQAKSDAVSTSTSSSFTFAPVKLDKPAAVPESAPNFSFGQVKPETSSQPQAFTFGQTQISASNVANQTNLTFSFSSSNSSSVTEAATTSSQETTKNSASTSTFTFGIKDQATIASSSGLSQSKSTCPENTSSFITKTSSSGSGSIFSFGSKLDSNPQSAFTNATKEKSTAPPSQLAFGTFTSSEDKNKTAFGAPIFGSTTTSTSNNSGSSSVFSRLGSPINKPLSDENSSVNESNENNRRKTVSFGGNTIFGDPKKELNEAQPTSVETKPSVKVGSSVILNKSSTSGSLFSTTSINQAGAAIGSCPDKPSFSFSLTTTSAPLFGQGTPNFSFGQTKNSTVTSSALITSGIPIATSQQQNTSASFNFGAKPTQSTSAFSFGNTTLSSSTQPFAFGVSSSTTATSTPFGSNSTVTSTASFGNQSSSTLPAFGASSGTPSFGTTTKAPAFGTNSVAPTFSAFGASTTAAPSFGNPVATAFGTTPAFGNTYGAPKTVPSSFAASPAFGATTTTTPAFGATTTTAPAFGATTTTAPAFGNPTAPAFGSNTVAPAFGINSTTSSFGTSATPAFGANTTSSGFGSTSTPGFGSSSSSVAFGNTSSPFRGAATTPTFGSATTSAFGSKSAFGSTSAPAFGSGSPAFGSQSTAPSFGSAAPTLAFGVSSSSTLESATAPAFGISTNPSATPAFGSNPSSASTPAFGAPSSSSTPFAFGAGNNTNPPAFNFGSSAVPSNQTAAPFGFGSGSSNNSGSSVFNFGANSASTPGSAFTFGANSSGFSQTPTPGSSGFSTPFGQTPSPGGFALPGTFSIGTGSSQPRSRASARLRRRP